MTLKFFLYSLKIYFLTFSIVMNIINEFGKFHWPNFVEIRIFLAELKIENLVLLLDDQVSWENPFYPE